MFVDNNEVPTLHEVEVLLDKEQGRDEVTGRG
jgi:hypothetical protein